MAVEWKDTTRRSQRDPKQAATTWDAECGPFRLTITSSHIHYPGEWIMHLMPIRDCIVMDGVKTEEEAKRWAASYMRNFADDLVYHAQQLPGNAA